MRADAFRLSMWLVLPPVGFVVSADYITNDPERWSIAAGLGFLGLLCHLGWRIGRNHPTDFGPADDVTTIRGVLMSAVVGFAFATPSWAWLPALLFVLAAFLDAVDGAIARRTGASEFGRRFDPQMDAYTILLGAIAAVSTEGIGAWYLLAGIIWYAYAGSLVVRSIRGLQVHALPPSRFRRPVGITQLVVLTLALTPLAPHPAISIFSAIALAALMVSFAGDWAAATGMGWHKGRSAKPSESSEFP